MINAKTPRPPSALLLLLSLLTFGVGVGRFFFSSSVERIGPRALLYCSTSDIITGTIFMTCSVVILCLYISKKVSYNLKMEKRFAV